jgi:hypothetical protein
VPAQVRILSSAFLEKSLFYQILDSIMRVLFYTILCLLVLLALNACISESTITGDVKGSRPGAITPSIRINQPDPHLGDTITFMTVGGKRVAIACFQGGIGNNVYSADQAVGTSFILGGTSSLCSLLCLVI